MPTACFMYEAPLYWQLSPFQLQDLFDEYSGEVMLVRNPSSDERREYYKDLLLQQATRAPPQKIVAGM